MGSIYIRDFSPSLYKRLKERAKQNRRSITQEALVIIEAALTERKPADHVWEEIDRVRERVSERYGSFGDSTAKIREDRRR
jgi:plasmid stability protein